MNTARKIRRGLHRLLFNPLFNRPYFLSLEVSSYCNADCKDMCQFARSYTYPRQHFLGSYIELLQMLKPGVVSLIGGEPLLNPKILDHIRDVSRELDRLTISLDFSDERHDSIRGINGLQRKIVDCLDRVKECGISKPRVGLQAVMRRDNVEDIERLAILAESYSISLSVNPYSPVKTRNYALTLENQASLQSSWLSLVERFGSTITSPFSLREAIAEYLITGKYGEHCLGGQAFGYVTVDGKYRVCDAVKESERDLWEEVREYSSVNKCVNCALACRTNTEAVYRSVTRFVNEPRQSIGMLLELYKQK